MNMKKFYLIVSGLLLGTALLNAQGIWITLDKSSGCAPLTINFTNHSHEYMDTSGMTFTWYFPDTIITGYHCSRTFTKAGHYSHMTVCNNNGCSVVPEFDVWGIPEKISTSTGSSACPGERIDM